MDQHDIVNFQMMAMMASNTNDLFNSQEMGRGVGSICGLNCWCPGCFGYYANHIDIILDIDKLYFEEFDELASRMVLTIKAHIRSTCELLLSYFMFSILIFGV
jgi:hypothetical protein